MAVTPIVLTNPGAETGDLTGWTQRDGAALASVTTSGGVTPHAGARFFAYSGITVEGNWNQQIDVSAFAAAIDAGTAAIKLQGWHNTLGTTHQGTLWIECYDNAGAVLLGDTRGVYTAPVVWTQETLYGALPSGTRKVRLGSKNANINTSGMFSDNLWAFWDDYTAEISDARAADYPTEHFAPIITQSVAYGLVTAPTEFVAAEQIPVLSVEASETASGLYKVFIHQTVTYALVRGRPDTRRARAWTFPQDDHDFYVLNAGANRTLVLDMLSRQWSVWKSPGKNIWRGHLGLKWEIDNVAGDVTFGILWNVNPSVRDDDSTTGLAADRVPITSIIRGLYPMRLRNALGCYRAVLTVSQRAPVAAGVGITLRTSDDSAKTWQNHGKLVMDASDIDYDVAWASLGLITSPGKIFEIIDDGYAQRIDALDIDLGPDEGRTSGN